jgi:hypothetical protein
VIVKLSRRSGGREAARVVLPVLDGRVGVARAGRDDSIVEDWDVEVGCWNQIGDPIVGTVFTGDHARVRPRLSPDGKTVALDLRYEVREPMIGEPPDSGMEVTGAIHPVLGFLRAFRGEVTLPVGEELTVPLGAGETLSIRCRTNLDPAEERR